MEYQYIYIKCFNGEDSGFKEKPACAIDIPRYHLFVCSAMNSCVYTIHDCINAHLTCIIYLHSI